MASRKKAVKDAAAPIERPTLIDEQDGVCEICAKHKDGLCDRCHKKIPVYENMGGRGYQSVVPSHFHLRAVEGNNGRAALWEELCAECYQKHRKQVYPNEQSK